MIRIVVLGEPMGKQRPRASFIAGHATIYTPKKTQSYEARFASAYADGHSDIPPTGEAISVEIRAFFSLAKADFNSKGEPNKKGLAKLNGEIRPTKKPDCDNIAKAVLDGLNGVAFIDDSQVVELSIQKGYSLQPKVEVDIIPINP
jgi:Holliday junction resolvase RusA-like endonuclease